jgi:hypothetical protein
MMEAQVSAGETSQRRVQFAARPDWVGSGDAGVVGRGTVRVVGVEGTATQ